MDIALLYLLVGIVMLTWSSDRFVLGACGIAKYFKVSSLFIGLTLVALGTSAPEIMVSIIAAMNGSVDMAIGNVVGSNIANIGFVLGTAAMISPVKIESRIMRREFPLLILFMLTVLAFFYDLYFSRLEGVLLFLMLMLLFIWFWRYMKSDRDLGPTEIEKLAGHEAHLSLRSSIGWFLVGLVLLPLSARGVVIGASEMARLLGVNEVIIGLTVVAIGTSLPEAGASIAAGLRGEKDIAIGNVIGSNMFNLVAVLPFVALLAPSKIDPIVLYRDLPVMFGFALLLYALSYRQRSEKSVNRIQGGFLFALYLGYLLYIVMGEWGQ